MTIAAPGTPRLAIFDCDGTLVDSGADIVAAMACTFGVAWNHRELCELVAAGAEAVAQTPADLLVILEETA